MKKVKLDLDQLNVDSFSTTARKPLKWGTVRGHGWPEPELGPGETETASGMVKCECQPITFGSQDTCESHAALVCPAEWTDGSCGPESCGADICV